jgi:Fic family protein
VDTSRLSRSPIGSLVPISGFDLRTQSEYNTHAFLPAQLPKQLDNLSTQTHMAVADAASRVARADQAVNELPNPELLARLAILREARSTSAIEGTYVGMEDVLKADFEDASDISSDVAEVRNYIQIAEIATETIKDRPVTVALLEYLQGILVNGTPSNTTQAGHVRTTDVFIGVKSANVEDARFVPCPHGYRLRDGLLDWEGWINEASPGMHLIVRMAVGHYQFETLHPFNDGNGRLGRLVLLLQLMRTGELAHPVVALSPWLEARRHEYQDQLFEVSATGDFEPWIQFICAAATAQAKEAVERIRTLVDLKKRMLITLHQAKSTGVTLRIAEDLIGYPMLTITWAAKRYGVTYQTVSNAVNKLVDLGLLRQYSEGNYGRVFINDEALRVLVG